MRGRIPHDGIFRGGVIAICVAAALSLAGTNDASGAPRPGDPEVIVGQSQTTDPTRYDYVPSGPSAAGTDATFSALGCGVIKAFTMDLDVGIGTVPYNVPQGFLCHQIIGAGMRIDRETAAYGPSPSIGALWGFQMCGWRIDFQNRSNRNSNVYTWPGATYPGCSPAGVSVSRNKRNYAAITPGLQCARLFVNGYFRGETCHGVNP